MPTIIPPSIGRVVLFWPNSAVSGHSAEAGGLNIRSGLPQQPLDAHVVYVWNDRIINIGGFDHSGVPFRCASVRLIQEGDEPRREGESVCTWMDYQVAQAKKYEALADKAVNAK
jgi:hypothetical protein